MKIASIVLRLLAPSPGAAGAPTCKYHPSCSQYAVDAMRRHGVLKGSAKTAWRLARCNPWSHGGVDHA